MATTADFRIGLNIEYNNDLFTIIDFQHVKPGKGPAFVRTKLRNLKNGKVIDNTFNAGVKIETARVERRPYQFLYKDEVGFNFMDTNTFEQINIEERVINAPQFLKEGQEVEVVIHTETDTVLGCELPAFVILRITYTEPGLRGDTASGNASKPATLDTGAVIQVPLFVNNDILIKVDTRDGKYVERVKE